MKKIAFILILLNLELACLSCNNQIKKPLCNLTITLDSTFDYDLLSGTLLHSNNFDSSVDWIYDPIDKTTSYHWDSLSSGNYNFEIISIFSKKQNLNFSLNTDEKLVIKNELGFKTTDLIEMDDLIKSDTIEFVFKSSGCFHSYLEKSLLVKNKSKNTYNLNTTSNKRTNLMYVEKVVPPAIIDSLFQLQLNIKNLVDKAEKNEYYFSTTKKSFFLIANNKLFKFNDEKIPDWNLYDKFRPPFIEIE